MVPILSILLCVFRSGHEFLFLRCTKSALVCLGKDYSFQGFVTGSILSFRFHVSNNVFIFILVTFAVFRTQMWVLVSVSMKHLTSIHSRPVFETNTHSLSTLLPKIKSPSGVLTQYTPPLEKFPAK